jgi:hypothetical protein
MPRADPHELLEVEQDICAATSRPNRKLHQSPLKQRRRQCLAERKK